MKKNTSEEQIESIKKKFESASEKQSFLVGKIKALDERVSFGMNEYKNSIKEAIRKPYRPTKFQDIVESWLAEMREHKMEMGVVSENPDDSQGEMKAVAIEQLIDWYKTKTNSKDKVDEAIEDACSYGFGVVFDYYNFVTGEPVCQWVDWKEIFIDPRAKNQKEIKWIIRKRKYTKAEYEELFSTFGKSFEEAKDEEENEENSNFISEIENAENNFNVNETDDDEIYIYDYYSVEDKKHIVFSSIKNTADETSTKNIILEEEYILKRVPIVFYYHIKKNRSIWGISPIEKGASSVDLDVNMTNLALKSIKAGMQPALIVDGNSGLTSATTIAPGKIFPVAKMNSNRKISDLIHKVDFSADLNGFDYLKNTLERDTVIATKMDDSLSAPVEQKVGNAKLKAQSRNKQVNSLVKKMLISSEKLRTEHLIDLIVNVIVPNRESNESVHKTLKIKVKKHFVLDEGEEKIPRFVKNSGASGIFEAKSEIIKGEYLVETKPIKDKAILKEQEQKNFVELLNQIQRIAQFSPDVLQNLDFQAILEEGFEAFGIDQTKILKTTTADEFKKNKVERIEKEHNDLLVSGNIEEPDEEIFGENGETPEESRVHLEAHMQFMKENSENLDPNAKMRLIQHIQNTAKNIKKQ